MKILVAIANYGTTNDGYLSQVLDEFRKMPYRVDMVVNTNIPKSLGPDVEVVLGYPAKDPRSLPFAHKKIFAERAEDYDLFIYTEDDTLVTETNIKAFLDATRVLHDDEITGFLRTETRADGEIYFPEVHQHFHWDTESLCYRGSEKFAFFTDEHSGSYAMTRDQLRKAIASGGFLLPFYNEKYPPLETAATDPYVRCGFRKMMCITRFQDFIQPHLSNKYAGNGITIPGVEFYRQLDALLNLSINGRPKKPLFPVETKLYHGHWSKSYYEPRQEQLLALVPENVRRVLSVGCGWGLTEKWLVDRGTHVSAIPIDPLIGACAEARGIEVIHGELEEAARKFKDKKFDCILMSNILHLVPKPVEFLSCVQPLLSKQGRLIASVPQLSRLRRLGRAWRLRGHRANPNGYDASGMHTSTGKLLQHWFREARLSPVETVYEVPQEKDAANKLTLGWAKASFASNAYVVGVRT